jgi:hypothetical protein
LDAWHAFIDPALHSHLPDIPQLDVLEDPYQGVARATQKAKSKDLGNLETPDASQDSFGTSDIQKTNQTPHSAQSPKVAPESPVTSDRLVSLESDLSGLLKRKADEMLQPATPLQSLRGQSEIPSSLARREFSPRGGIGTQANASEGDAEMDDVEDEPDVSSKRLRSTQIMVEQNRVPKRTRVGGIGKGKAGTRRPTAPTDPPRKPARHG